MPVVVFKGIEGWCDRLQVLGHCFAYCRKYNTALCVDWDDAVWCGMREFDFYDVFEVVGIKTVTKDQVIRLMAMGKERVKVVPPCWTIEELIRFPLSTMDKEHEGPLMKFNVEGKIDGDVIVTNGRGERSWDCTDIARHLRIRPKMRDAIVSILKDFNPYGTTVHLRGTDRPDKGYVENAIRFLCSRQSTGIINIVTDSRELWEQVHAAVPHAKLVNPNAKLLNLPPSVHGTHQTDARELKRLGITKWDMLVDLLADWFAMCFSKGGIGREESTYFSMARSMNTLGVDECEKVLGWKPMGILPPFNNGTESWDVGKAVPPSNTGSSSGS